MFQILQIWAPVKECSRGNVNNCIQDNLALLKFLSKRHSIEYMGKYGGLTDRHKIYPVLPEALGYTEALLLIWKLVS